MPKKSAVVLLSDVARNRTDAAARDLGALAAQGRSLEEKLAILMRYRDDYRARFREAVGKGIDRAEWENYQNFLARLDTAIDLQRSNIAEAARDVSAGQARWREERRKLESFNALARRRAAADAHAAGKREQREHDEQSAKTDRMQLSGGHHK